jgi:AraC-like DNA-binding protein
MPMLNESLSIRMEDADGLVIIKEDVMIGERAPTRQAIELAVGVLFRTLRELLGTGWEARRVCFMHRAPASLASHVRVFGRFVEFGCEFNGIVCAAKDLEIRNRLADPILARYARQYLDAMFAQPHMATKDKVRQLVYALLPSGHCSIERVAEHLGVDRRTLHRHLARSNDTFSAIVDSARRELVTRYIENRDRRLTEVAELLGFSAQSAFARWFRAVFGCSASAWRLRHSNPER